MSVPVPLLPLQRAISAYYRFGGAAAVSMADCEAVTTGGRAYIVLRGRDPWHDLLAVYRIQTDGQLKRLKRWPPEIS